MNDCVKVDIFKRVTGGSNPPELVLWRSRGTNQRIPTAGPRITGHMLLLVVIILLLAYLVTPPRSQQQPNACTRSRIDHPVFCIHSCAWYGDTSNESSTINLSLQWA